MTFLATVVALFAIAIAAPVYGQIEITSELSADGRNFSCTGEFITYTCSGQGNTLAVNFPPLFSRHLFIIDNPVPSAVPTASNAVLTLTNRVENSSGIFYTANLQIKVLSDAQQTRINVSCSTNTSNNAEKPLIHESQIEPPSTVTFSGDTTVSWTPPVNPQFDIDYYLVTFYMNGVLYTTRSSRDNGLDVKLPSGEFTADVRTFTTCGTMSAPRQSPGSVTGGCANGSVSVAAVLICVLLIIAVV